MTRPAEPPDHFEDDGCTGWFDRFFGADLRPACRRHDWAYCTRAHPPGSMTHGAKVVADRELRLEMQRELHWAWDWTAGLLWRALQIGGSWGAWDSCGPSAGALCRHNMRMPVWMAVRGQPR